MNTIIFDLDNTLTDRNATIRRYADVFVEAFREQLHPEVTSLQLFDLFLESDGGGYEGHQSELLSRHRIWSGIIEAEVLTRHWKDWVPRNSEPMAGLYEMLDWLAGKPVKLGLITNGSSLAQRSKIERLKVAERFDAIVISEEAGVKKPNPEIFELAVRKLRTSAASCVFVGDDPTNDYQGAVQAGMTPIWFAGFRPWIFDEEAKIKIASLYELPEILENLLNLPDWAPGI